MTPESLAHVQQLLLEQLELERRPCGRPEANLRIEMEYYRKDGSTVWLENQVSRRCRIGADSRDPHAISRLLNGRSMANSFPSRPSPV